MLILVAFAFISGIITILSPCILPVLPIVLSGSVGGKSRPYGVITGFIASFTLFTLALSTLVRLLNIPADILRYIAVAFIVLFGLVMIVPKLRHGFESLATRINIRRNPDKPSAGFAGGLLVGFSLGLVWTPCVGPIIASVITLAITQSVDGGSIFIILAYSLGTSIPMLAIMLGGRKLINRFPGLQKNTGRIQQVFGVLMIIVGISIGFGLDRRFQSAILTVFPNYGSGLTAIENIDPVRNALDNRNSRQNAEVTEGSSVGENYRLVWDEEPKRGRLENFGPAPDIVTDGAWLNSEELTMTDLKGKVVLLDFWTYSCINCVRTIPHLRAWYNAYKDDGLVIIGVHTPEFAFENREENVRKAIDELGVTWPVVLDNDYKQWRAYNNRYWPAHYFIDAEGNVRYFHFGEGQYDTSEKVIRALLREAGMKASGRAEAPPEADLEGQTPETYLGFGRAEAFISEDSMKANRPVAYSLTQPGSGELDNGEWGLEGTWTISREYIVPEDDGVLELEFYAKNVFLVIEPETEGTITVRLDAETGPETPDVSGGRLTARESRLYQLVELDKPGRHTLNLEVEGELRLFAFTFG